MKKIDYRNAFFDELVKIGMKDKNVIFLSADTDADSLQIFKKKFPERFINTGVAEQETINLAAGLALSGKKVFPAADGVQKYTRVLPIIFSCIVSFPSKNVVDGTIE